ncbi:hypothetical protein M011DRAFT_407634 [Sporormia fimetaria CBS 119925]|uniref:Rhodopsin domain-containing protein n=1 Tax=Sporormia fimetaria CBS 119925 TaxID=1340428 RepID=A0A6A6V2I4_9PLEO|nr:hypothetical protein M011DRAFT_407634 [Sporormia fimetaria CBS 119925]
MGSIIIIPYPETANDNLPLMNQRRTILAVVLSFLIVALLAIVFRVYVRWRVRLWGWDDLMVILAGVGITVASGLTCIMPDYGLGKHFGTLPDIHRMEYYKHVWATNIGYVCATTFIKLSILFQYLRLFSNAHHRPLVPRRVTQALLTLTALWGLTFFLLAIFSCRPIAKNWNFKLAGTCVAWGSKDPNIFFASWAAHAASNMLFDILVFLLPAPFLKSLRLSGKSRVGLTALFSIGALVVALSMARLISLCHNRAGTIPDFDPSYATPSIYIFSALEVNIAILCASIPIFWPYVQELAGFKGIVVVNEIEIRSQRRGSQGAVERTVGIPGLDGNSGAAAKGRVKSTVIGGFVKEASIASSDDDVKITALPKRAHSRSRSRSMSRILTGQITRHAPKSSNASSASSASARALGRRLSRESEERLNMGHQKSDGTLSSASWNEENSLRVGSPDLGGGFGMQGFEYLGRDVQRK